MITTMMMKQRPKIRPEKRRGKKITMSGLSVSPITALKQYSDRELLDKAAHYYEQEGIPIPEFEKLDKIEKLEMLNVYKEQQNQIRADLDAKNKQMEEYHKLISQQKQKDEQRTANSGGITK